MANNVEITGIEATTISQRSSGEICPRCGQAAFPAGTLIVSPVIKINQLVSFWFVKFPISISLVVRYDPKCGYLSVKGE